MENSPVVEVDVEKENCLTLNEEYAVYMTQLAHFYEEHAKKINKDEELFQKLENSVYSIYTKSDEVVMSASAKIVAFLDMEESEFVWISAHALTAEEQAPAAGRCGFANTEGLKDIKAYMKYESVELTGYFMAVCYAQLECQDMVLMTLNENFSIVLTLDEKKYSN